MMLNHMTLSKEIHVSVPHQIFCKHRGENFPRYPKRRYCYCSNPCWVKKKMQETESVSERFSGCWVPSFQELRQNRREILQSRCLSNAAKNKKSLVSHGTDRYGTRNDLHFDWRWTNTDHYQFHDSFRTLPPYHLVEIEGIPKNSNQA